MDYVLRLGCVSIGMGLFMIVSDSQTPALRTLMSVVFLCVLSGWIPKEKEYFSLPELPQISSVAMQEEAECWVMESYIDQLVAEVKKYAGAEAKVFITLHSDKSVASVNVYHAQNIEGLRAYIQEKLAPQEVNIFKDEEDYA